MSNPPLLTGGDIECITDRAYSLAKQYLGEAVNRKGRDGRILYNADERRAVTIVFGSKGKNKLYGNVVKALDAFFSRFQLHANALEVSLEGSPRLREVFSGSNVNTDPEDMLSGRVIDLMKGRKLGRRVAFTLDDDAPYDLSGDDRFSQGDTGRYTVDTEKLLVAGRYKGVFQEEDGHVVHTDRPLLAAIYTSVAVQVKGEDVQARGEAGGDDAYPQEALQWSLAMLAYKKGRQDLVRRSRKLVKDVHETSDTTELFVKSPKDHAKKENRTHKGFRDRVINFAYSCALLATVEHLQWYVQGSSESIDSRKEMFRGEYRRKRALVEDPAYHEKLKRSSKRRNELIGDNGTLLKDWNTVEGHLQEVRGLESEVARLESEVASVTVDLAKKERLRKKHFKTLKEKRGQLAEAEVGNAQYAEFLTMVETGFLQPAGLHNP